MPTVTLDEAREYVSKESERRNGKIIRQVPRILREMTTEPHWYVFNVGPWPFSRQMGGSGTKYLAACLPTKKYSVPLTFPVLYNETVATDMNKMENIQEEGDTHLNAFLLEGYGCTPQDSLKNWGVGVCEQWPPTADDLIEPNKRLKKKFDELIAEADAFYEKREFQNIGEYHRLAARALRQTRGWLNASPDTDSCKNCGSTINTGIAQCPHCKVVLDRELHMKNFPELYEKGK